ncbi:HDIG domain-containing protein [Candidatus Peregrinibacteria bacterium]|nr:MAG: HDIG domain-containing protein [Candidatus Peregrinibacteria bacterium]
MNLLALMVGLALSVGTVFLFTRGENLEKADPNEALKKAEIEAKQIHHDSKEAIERIRRAMEREEKDAEEILSKMEATLAQKEEILKRREERNKTHQDQVSALKTEVEALHTQEKQTLNQRIELLSKQAKLSREETLENSKKNLEKLITENADVRNKVALDELQEDAPRHAKALLQVVIQRLGVESSVDKNNTSITIKDDKFKGLLIGKNGSNVLYFESLLPVSLIFNHGAPDVLHVGGVNLFRRNIAKRAIEKLQVRAKKTGKIDHEMIKTTVDEANAEMMALCDKKGEESIRLMGLDPKKMDPEMVNYTGRLYYRTSYGQNVTGHSNEMGFAARMLAELIGLQDPSLAMQGAFFHDIGKAIDHDVGGAHDDLSREILDKHGFDPIIVHAAFAHHDKVPCESPEDFLVKAVDAISGGRPGARQESVTNYFERIQALEQAALSFEGVNKVFAMSAGRELRLIVDTSRIQDESMEGLAEQVAGKIQDEIAFPGVIKVNLIRTTKSVDYAREKPQFKR